MRGKDEKCLNRSHSGERDAFKAVQGRGWRDGQRLRALAAFPGTQIQFPALIGSSQPSVSSPSDDDGDLIPVSRDLLPFYGLCGHCTHVMLKHTINENEK